MVGRRLGTGVGSKPGTANVVIYRSRTEVSVLTKKDNLVGGTLVPGFEIPVTEIFAE